MALALAVGTLWALLALLARAEQPPGPVTVTAPIGGDVCLPCGTQAWGELLGATLGCSLLARGDRAEPVFLHRLDEPGPPLEPGWQPPLEPLERFRGRVAFCPAGTGGAGVSLLLKNLSQADFGKYSCYVSRYTGPRLLCSVYLQPGGAEAPRDTELDMVMVIGVLVSVLTVLAIGVLCARRRAHCWGSRARSSSYDPINVSRKKSSRSCLVYPGQSHSLRPPAAGQALV